MVDIAGMFNKVVIIREIRRESDIEVVVELEKKCKSDHNGFAILTDRIVVDPLCRIRLYPLHLMLVAELRETGELVGVISGCIKHVGTTSNSGGSLSSHVKLGSILGLRVSPTHRRKGIGLQLVEAMEEWMTRNKADYTFLATEKNNMASTSLFTLKCNYKHLSSLLIFVQLVMNNNLLQTSDHRDDLPKDIRIQKLCVGQAISLYENKLRGNTAMYPTDIDAILTENMSLGTWVLYFKQEKWSGLESGDHGDIEDNVKTSTPSSWIVFSIWSPCNAYCKNNEVDQVTKSSALNLKSFVKATVSHARDKILPCLKFPLMFCDASMSLDQKPFGFFFLYGVYGEGERLGELMKCAWAFTLRLARNVKGCKVVIAEIGVSDPLVGHVPREGCVSCIEDVWYLKKANAGSVDLDGEDLGILGQLGNVFVDPRDL